MVCTASIDINLKVASLKRNDNANSGIEVKSHLCKFTSERFVVAVKRSPGGTSKEQDKALALVEA